MIIHVHPDRVEETQKANPEATVVGQPLFTSVDDWTIQQGNIKAMAIPRTILCFSEADLKPRPLRATTPKQMRRKFKKSWNRWRVYE